MPFADTEATQRQIDEISGDVARAMLIMDRTGWHTTTRLETPKNINPIFPPSRAPELDPVENVSHYLTAIRLSHRVFETCEAIVATACEAWQKLLAKPLDCRTRRVPPFDFFRLRSLDRHL